MNELVFPGKSGRDITTSLKVAEKFGKDHDKVCRDIESLSCSAEFNTANFGVIYYRDSMNRERKAYEMTKDGFSFLVMGYTGREAGKFKEDFIRAFNQRDALLKNDDFIISRAMGLLQNRVNVLTEKAKELERSNQAKEQIITDQAPKVLFADTVTASSNSILIGELAKLICQRGVEIGQNRLFAWLRKYGYLLSRPGEFYNKPAQRYIEQGMFELKKSSITMGDGTVLVTTTPKVTGKGQVYFVNKFLRAHEESLKEAKKNAQIVA